MDKQRKVHPMTESSPISDLYQKLEEAEREIASGAKGQDFLTVTKSLRKLIHGAENTTVK